MDTKKLNRWAELLLDTGKRNNLVNFKDTKASSVEVLFPNTATLFSKAENSPVFEVYDPKLADDEDELEEADASLPTVSESAISSSLLPLVYRSGYPAMGQIGTITYSSPSTLTRFISFIHSLPFFLL